LIHLFSRTDTERKEFAEQEFGNKVPSDPTRCLTYFGFKRMTADERNHERSRPIDKNLVDNWAYTKLEDGKLYNEIYSG
jgi:hypothetical protein